jgi:hypothetical protein
LINVEAPSGLSTVPLFIQQGTADVATRAEWLLGFLQRRLNLKGRMNPAGLIGSTGYYIGDRISEIGEPHTLSSERNVTLFVVEGGFHDLIHDIHTPQCLERLVDWVKNGLARGRNNNDAAKYE